ncbi:hypothetical protein D3C87_1728860 [compost metagenome]
MGSVTAAGSRGAGVGKGVGAGLGFGDGDGLGAGAGSFTGCFPIAKAALESNVVVTRSRTFVERFCVFMRS